MIVDRFLVIGRTVQGDGTVSSYQICEILDTWGQASRARTALEKTGNKVSTGETYVSDVRIFKVVERV